jgi:DNA-binding HxlR family transcriptional regulator
MENYQTDVFSSQCPSRSVLNLIADKWSLLLLYGLSQKSKMRYGQLQRQVEGISQKMLTQTLRELERNGFISRTVYEVIPPQVEYQLTELGSSLRNVIAGLCTWSESNMPKVIKAQQQYDQKSPTKPSIRHLEPPL